MSGSALCLTSSEAEVRSRNCSASVCGLRRRVAGGRARWMSDAWCMRDSLMAIARVMRRAVATPATLGLLAAGAGVGFIGAASLPCKHANPAGSTSPMGRVLDGGVVTVTGELATEGELDGAAAARGLAPDAAP